MNVESVLATELAGTSKWNAKPLGDVVSVLDSRRKPITKSDRVAGPYPYYGATGVLDWVEGYIFDEPLVLIGEDGAKWGAGDHSAFAIRGKTWVNNHAHVLRPDREQVLDEWLIHYLNAADLGEFVSGMTVPKLNQARLREIPIPVPSLDVQQQVISVLNRAFTILDRARENTQANRRDAAELFERELAVVFERASADAAGLSFNRLCTTVTPKIKIQRKHYLKEGEHPIVSQESDLISGYWDDSDALLGIDEPVVVFGDHTRCLKYIDFDFVVGADGTKVMRANEGISPLYLFYGFRNMTIPENGYARHFRFLTEAVLPSLDHASQEALAVRLQEFEEKALILAELYDSKLDDIDDLRQSLAQRAFAGELA